MSDEALMGRLNKKNDPKALTELYARYSKKLLGYFINMFGGDVEKAEDFLQDIFIKIMEKGHQFDSSRKFYSWIFTIASNMCKTEFRKPQIKHLTSEKDQETVNSLRMVDDNLMDSKTFKIDLKQSINSLSHDHKAVFVLRYHQNFSMQEIADITDSNIGTVKSRLFYATKKVTEQLKGYKPENDSPQFKMN
ncbi:MAG: RNA polymerase sigma factor [Crocinitomicaceae bacterium]